MNPALQTNLIAIHHQAGEDWLNNLPSFLQLHASKLGITFMQPFSNLSYHYVAPVIMPNGETAVFKCTIPNSEFERDVNALLTFDSNTSVKVFAHDTNQGWALLEHCQPGIDLTNVDDSIAINAIAHLLSTRISTPSEKLTYAFPSISDWLQRLNNPVNHSEQSIHTNNAQSIKQDLLSDQQPQYLLHGDLHHANILTAQREPYLMIDPKGVIGESMYELTPMMYNPINDLIGEHSESRLRNRLQRRMSLIQSNINIDSHRLWLWCYVQACLSMCWFIDDNLAEHAAKMLHITKQFNHFI